MFGSFSNHLKQLQARCTWRVQHQPFTCHDCILESGLGDSYPKAQCLRGSCPPFKHLKKQVDYAMIALPKTNSKSFEKLMVGRLNFTFGMAEPGRCELLVSRRVYVLLKYEQQQMDIHHFKPLKPFHVKFKPPPKRRGPMANPANMSYPCRHRGDPFKNLPLPGRSLFYTLG